MTDTIRIHPMDTDEEATKRHQEIVARLEVLGHNQVALMQQTGGFPTNWNTIVTDWLGRRG